MPRLLLVEDNARLARALAEGLAAHGYRVVVAPDLAAAEARLSSLPDLAAAVVDRMLPDGDGAAWVGALRERGRELPMLLLTARDAVADRVAGLEAGADDYLVKPVALPELVARIRAVTRRHRGRAGQRVRVADLIVDFECRRAERGGRPIPLTAREFEVLACLARAPGRVLSRAQIVADAYAGVSPPSSNAVDVQIARLRSKVDRGHPTKLIHTRRGLGYVLAEDP